MKLCLNDARGGNVDGEPNREGCAHAGERCRARTDRDDAGRRSGLRRAMTGDEGNKTVFKPSPLQDLKEAAPDAQRFAGPARAKPSAPPPEVKAADVAEPPPAPASAAPAPPAPGDPTGARKPAAAGRRRAGSFPLAIAVGAALALLILYFIFAALGMF